MTSGLKKLWIEALESGRYKQGKNNLRNNDNTYCCLGVLCDVVAPDKWKKAKKSLYVDTLWLHKRESALLSTTMTRKVGLTLEQQQALTELNDDFRPNAYKRVVKWIKENL